MGKIVDLIVFGNAAEDFVVHPDEIRYIEGQELAFVKDGIEKKVLVREDDIIAAEKPRFYGMTIDDILNGIAFERQAGGGGVHGAVWLAENGMNPLYLDVSAPNDVVSQRLREHCIEPIFLDYREVPRNLVVDIGKSGLGKIVVRGQKLDRVEQLRENHIGELNDLTSKTKVLFLNAPKDTYVVNHLMQMVTEDTQVMFVVTDSLPRDFVMDKLMPHGITAMSRKGLYRFGEMLGLRMGDDTLQYSVDIMNALRSKTRSRFPLMAIASRDGVLCSAWGHIYNVYIKPGDLGAPPRQVTTHRAEDVFAAAVLHEYLKQGMKHPVEIATSALIAELKHRGYTGVRPELIRVDTMHPRHRTFLYK